MPINPWFNDRLDALTTWRRHLHAHPETAFQEHATAEFVAEKLKSFGIEVHRGLAGTGVVGRLEGAKAGDSIALRADLDALAMDEETGLPHCSTHAGRMHACGHDGHVVMLLGAAEYLAQSRAFSGVVHFVFQPAEENEGGGRVMVEEGLFEKFPSSQVFGMHNWPALPAGEFAVHDGAVMAAADRFEVKIEGRGGHGAMPHQTNDVVVAGAHLVTALQTIVSRTIDPVSAAVVTVTRFNAGSTFNVIPGRAELWGTTRSFDPVVRDAIEKRMAEMVEGLEKTFGVKATLSYRRGYPATINTAPEAEVAAVAARAVVGDGLVHRNPPPTMGAEDFAYMLHETPGCYVWIGSGRPGENPGLHHPRFDFNDSILPIGASYWSTLVESRLAL